jgi:hypothetical protein
MLFTRESRKNITNGIRRIRISKVNNNTEKKERLECYGHGESTIFMFPKILKAKEQIIKQKIHKRRKE